jgi:hypothetical protein
MAMIGARSPPRRVSAYARIVAGGFKHVVSLDRALATAIVSASSWICSRSSGAARILARIAVESLRCSSA